MALPLIHPDWPAPSGVHAVVTTRDGGVSDGVYASLNLGNNCGDDPGHVSENRRILCDSLALPSQPAWLRQVHGAGVVQLPGAAEGTEADASFTTQAGPVCAVLAADCLPVLFCDSEGTLVAAAHAGWRGLAAGVLRATVRALPARPESLMAWLGPAIGPESFEVGPEVRSAFVTRDPGTASAFRPLGGGRFLADLFALARRDLAAAGVRQVFGGGLCTFRDPARFFSHRRDGSCGRMAALAWMDRRPRAQPQENRATK